MMIQAHNCFHFGGVDGRALIEYCRRSLVLCIPLDGPRHENIKAMMSKTIRDGNVENDSGRQCRKRFGTAMSKTLRDGNVENDSGRSHHGHFVMTTVVSYPTSLVTLCRFTFTWQYS
jgi:hypothetical protein